MSSDSATHDFLGRLAAQHRAAEAPRPTGRRGTLYGIERGGWQSGRVDRLTEEWQPTGIGPNLVHRLDGRLTRNRIRDLVENNPYAQGGVDAYVANVVECGIRPKPLFGESDRRWMWLDAWENYGGRYESEVDITGHQSVYELQALFLEEVIVGGGCLQYYRQLEPSPTRVLPLAVELLPEERFADDMDDFVLWANRQKSGNPIIRGIELEAGTNRPVRYWIRSTLPNEIGASYSEPIGLPAEHCRYAFLRRRIGQQRGSSMLRTGVQWLWKLGYFTDNELMASALKSCYSAVVTSDGDGDFPGLADDTDDWSVTDSAGNPLEKLQPGIIARLRPGESIQGVGPNTPTSESEAWIVMIQRAIAVSMSLSYEELCRDYSRGNFSSTRASANADRRRFRRLQRFVITNFCQPLWKRFASAAVLRGLDGFPRPAVFLANVHDWLRVAWRAPGWVSVNPVDDARASQINLEMGTTTRDRIAADIGDDWEDNFYQLDREEELAGELGLKLGSSARPDPATASDQQANFGGADGSQAAA